MAPRSPFVILIAACCIHALHAWPWDRKTTTTTAPPVISREEFMSLLTAANETVSMVVAYSHQLVTDADQADKEGQGIAQGIVDVAAYLETFTKEVNDYVSYMDDVDVAPCIASYMDSKAEIESYIIPEVQKFVKKNMAWVRRSAAEDLDGQLQTMAAILERGKAEVALPDGEYGRNVDAILKEADKASRDAYESRDYIYAYIFQVGHASEMVIFRRDGPALYASQDMAAAVSCSTLCMRRTYRASKGTIW